MDDRQYYNAAEEILALVGDNPPELFSLERKFLVDRIKNKLMRVYQIAEDELDTSYSLGYDLGHDEGCSETREDYEDRISELEEELEELRRDLEESDAKIDQAFADGYQTASRDDKIVETLRFE